MTNRWKSTTYSLGLQNPLPIGLQAFWRSQCSLCGSPCKVRFPKRINSFTEGHCWKAFPLIRKDKDNLWSLLITGYPAFYLFHETKPAAILSLAKSSGRGISHTDSCNFQHIDVIPNLTRRRLEMKAKITALWQVVSIVIAWCHAHYYAWAGPPV